MCLSCSQLQGKEAKLLEGGGQDASHGSLCLTQQLQMSCLQVSGKFDVLHWWYDMTDASANAANSVIPACCCRSCHYSETIIVMNAVGK